MTVLATDGRFARRQRTQNAVIDAPDGTPYELVTDAVLGAGFADGRCVLAISAGLKTYLVRWSSFARPDAQACSEFSSSWFWWIPKLNSWLQIVRVYRPGHTPYLGGEEGHWPGHHGSSLRSAAFGVTWCPTGKATAERRRFAAWPK